MTEKSRRENMHAVSRRCPPLPRDEALRFQAQAADWELRDDARRIERIFRFRNFRERLPSCSKSASLPRAKAITPISVSAGVTRPFL